MEHLSQEQVRAYHTRSLSGAELLRVSDHLFQCEACQAWILQDSDLGTAAAAVSARLQSEAGGFTHLTYDEIAAYVDGQASGGEAEWVRLHARECAACAADLHEIQSLKTFLDASRSGLPQPAYPARFWRAIHGWQAVFVFAAAAACVMLVALAIRPRAAHLTAKLEPAKQVRRDAAPAAPAAAGAVIRDGNRTITLSAAGPVGGLEDLPVGLRTAVERALATGRIETPRTVAGLAAKRGVLLGPSTTAAGVELLQPVGIIVETSQPVFSWKPLAGAEYRVSVYDSDFQQVAGSKWIQQTEWQTPVALRRGARYVWQLSVRRDGSEFTVPAPPDPEARFQVLDAAREAELNQWRSAWRDSHLVMGVAYAQAGLLNEAKREMQAVVDENPASAKVAALAASLNRLGVSSDQRQSH